MCVCRNCIVVLGFLAADSKKGRLKRQTPIARLCIYIYIFMYMYNHAYISHKIYIRTHTNIYVHTYIHTYIYIYICIHTFILFVINLWLDGFKFCFLVHFLGRGNRGMAKGFGGVLSCLPMKHRQTATCSYVACWFSVFAMMERTCTQF